MSEQVVFGYAAAIVAVFFFGTCYVPAKTYATYDGIIFQWFMCSGILMVGIAWGLLSNNWSQFSQSGMFTFPEGLLGGALFAIANLLIPTVVNTLGLGVGFMLWNATNITLGYCVSRLGLFGVSPTIPSMPWVSLLGIGFMLASIAVYGTIKPTLKAARTSRRHRRPTAKRNGDADAGDGDAKVHWDTVGSSNSLTSSLGETSPLLPQFAADAELAKVALVRRESLHESLVHPELPNFGPYMMPNELGEHVELTDAGAEKTRKAFGMAIALLVGAFLSCCLVPFVNWKDRCRPSDPALSSPIVETCNPLNFVFSQCLGVYLTSTIVFLLYSLFHRFVLKRSMPRSVMRPAYICGVLWGIGLCGQLYAIGQLGFDQIFPICSIGPAMVSMLWSAGYFKEIQGHKNLYTLGLGTVLVLIGTGLRVISMPVQYCEWLRRCQERQQRAVQGEVGDIHEGQQRWWPPAIRVGRASRVKNIRGSCHRVADRQDAFDPSAKAVMVWDHVLLLCLLLELFLLPYLLSFQSDAVEMVSGLFVLVVVCEGVFALDLYVQAHTGYYLNGNLIRDKQRTIRRYVHSVQFVLDVVAILPTEALVVGYPSIVPRLFLLKLLRCSRLPYFVSSLDELYAKYFVGLKLLKVLASTVYLAHVLACVRFSLSGDSHSHHGQYLASLFWSVGIMTGLFEGELPHHSSELMLTILVALCGFSMFTTLCATIFVISKCESGQLEAMEARINQLVHILSFHRVPESQQTQAIEYLKRYYTDMEANDRETAKLLCPSIATDIQVDLLMPTIAQIAIFDGCSDRFIVAMASQLEMIALPARTTLFSTGDFGDAMYVVHSGVLAIVVKSMTVREIRKGSCFGELSVFSSMPRTATVMSTTYVILYKLSRFHCDRVLEGYPTCAKLVIDHVQEVLNQLNKVDSQPGSSAPTSSGSETRRTSSMSIAAGVVAGAATLVKVLSKRGKDAVSSPRKSLLPWIGRRKSVVPQDDSDPLAINSTKAVRLEIGQSEESSVLNPYDRHQFPRSTLGQSFGFWRRLLFRKCIDQHSIVRKWWLLLLVSNLCYCWVMIPVQVAFPLWQRPSWTVQALDMISNVGLVLDLVLNFSLSFMIDAEKIMDPERSAQRYFRQSFVFDLLCTVPFEYLDATRYGLLRSPRLLRVFHLRRHLKEIGHFVPFSSRRQLLLLGALLFMLFHIVTCIHFGISYVEGFNSNEDEAWISPINVCLRRLNATHLENCDGKVLSVDADQSELQAITALEYSRSLYYAVGVLASPGKSVEPTTDVQLVAALILMLSGFLITAGVVDNVQKRFTASAFEQKEFFATSTRIQLFLRRQNAPTAIHHRVKAFLDYWWSSHRGAVIGELLADLPRPIRLDLLRSICLPVLQTVALLHGVRPVLDKLEEVMVENAKFILYGQGEIVYRHGDSVVGLFFLLEGEVCVVEKGETSREVPRGGFFGTAALTQQERGEGYTEHVSANSGCILLLVSREQIQAMETIFPELREEALALEQRLLGVKISSMRAIKQKEFTAGEEPTSRILHNVLSELGQLFSAVHDPDSWFVLAWETWVFLAMTLQWALIMFQACYSLGDEYLNAEAVMLFLEISLLVDMQIRSRMGFYEFGNKVMDYPRIKRKYFRSGTFILDIVALVPLYIVNWCLPVNQRWGLLNANKLLRTFKVPRQFHALETRYVKHTTELRLFKLLYYTLLLSHFLGCIWFNFASKEAAPTFKAANDAKQTAFGDNLWLPSKHLETGPHILQYMASLYWSFGLMSASSEPEFPKTTAQCIFSAFTMTSGFFLFAYVIGNFADIIELKSSETREFDAKMRAIRQMLTHFTIPEALQQRVKTFLLFKRYHTITQEDLLVHCLPPPLLTDIRLVHLNPMIEKVEFLRGMEGSITRMLVSQFTQILISRGEFVCRFGESGNDMFFIFTGVVDILVPSRIANRHLGAFKSVVRNLVVKEGSEAVSAGRTGLSKVLGGSEQPAKGPEQLQKVNELSAGCYFGENGLFTNGKRNASVQAQTSCILYRLSRESMELVFARYPKWKQKVLRIANIRREQERLVQLSRDEQRRGLATITGLMLSRADIMNERAERLKEKLNHARLKRSNSARLSAINLTVVNWLKQRVLHPLTTLFDALVHGVPVQSGFHLGWLQFMVFCTMFTAIIVPYQLSMDSMDRATAIPTIVNALTLLCEVAFVLDVWVNWHVHESLAALELYEQKLRSVYKKQRLTFDLIAAIPVYGLLLVFHVHPWLKLLRCVKILNVIGYLDELNRRNVANELTRFCHVWTLYLLVIHWAACAYLAVAMEVGFGSEWDAWLPSQELEISDPQNPSPSQLARRFLRGVFFATTAFVKKARNLAPESASLYAFQISMSFTGLITMSFVIGELASLFISYIGLEVGFRKNHIAVELFLARLRVNDRLKSRTYAFMTSLWSSHAGVNYEELLTEDLPRPIRAACVLHASKEPLDWFVMKVFRPICWEGERSLVAFTLSLADKLRFEGYPRDENVITEGSIVRAMYFVTKGYLSMESKSLLDHPVGLRDGSYFGERGLLSCTISAYTVRTVRACDLFSLSSEAFAQVLQQHSFSRLALELCDCAYKQLKAKQLVACSRNDMEEHWGKALLFAVQETRKQQPLCTASGEISAEKVGHEAVTTAAESPVTDEVAVETSERQSTSEQKELPVHLSNMLKALSTGESCFEAFAPLLHTKLASDPLNWSTTFSSTQPSTQS
ncbi:hypothetical protein PF011_g11555 [Phytophthora fragariae]|uniref:Cyclic nucleotide-binding domain-containing protein n=1 Tax=Phytophthora fragariae TaxID=53985 RepID=A0A6A3KGF9_9STRA|nr:hypothetical protein PF011_g11555 [Phytophthora fragariae]